MHLMISMLSFVSDPAAFYQFLYRKHLMGAGSPATNQYMPSLGIDC
jgi:hypothetical protein